MELKFKDYFVIEEEHEKVSVCGTLKCSCGCDKFKIFHTGKQTKGIFSPYIVKTNKQIFVEAKCLECGKVIQIYDTSYDGEKPIIVDHGENKQFLYKEKENFKVRVFLNYYEENYMTNKFVTIYIHLIDENGKNIVLYEE